MPRPHESVIPVALCEAAHIILRPGQLYRAYVGKPCPECARLAEAYAEGPAPDPPNSSISSRDETDSLSGGEG